MSDQPAIDDIYDPRSRERQVADIVATFAGQYQARQDNPVRCLIRALQDATSPVALELADAIELAEFMAKGPAIDGDRRPHVATALQQLATSWNMPLLATLADVVRNTDTAVPHQYLTALATAVATADT